MKCDKCKQESTSSVQCPLCKKTYERCDKHGGKDGCNRSLSAHS